MDPDDTTDPSDDPPNMSETPQTMALSLSGFTEGASFNSAGTLQVTVTATGKCELRLYDNEVLVAIEVASSLVYDFPYTETNNGEHVFVARTTLDGVTYASAPLIANIAVGSPPPPGPAVDTFGIRMLHPSLANGHSWTANWSSVRSLVSGQTDPLDPNFRLRGSGGFFDIQGDGTALGGGTTFRVYIEDPTEVERFGDIELTFYGKRVSENNPTSSAGLIIEARTDDGHGNPAERTCIGNAYAALMTYDGRGVFKKELRHPCYSSDNPTQQVWNGGTMPYDTWIGFKVVVRDVQVGTSTVTKMTMYKDMTDGVNGGTWNEVISQTDSGSWVVDDPRAECDQAFCAQAPNRILTGRFPIIILRNDGGTVLYKHFSVREIQ